MLNHRITYVSNIDGKSNTRKCNEATAKALWTGMTSSYVRYAIWAELSGTGSGVIKEIRAEIHSKFYLHRER